MYWKKLQQVVVNSKKTGHGGKRGATENTPGKTAEARTIWEGTHEENLGRVGKTFKAAVLQGKIGVSALP